jgi:hypothetical protein
VLLEVRANKGNELQLDVYMPCAQGADERGTGGGVRELRVSRVRVERLREYARA